MELILFWFGFAIVVGVAANTRGRSGLGWFLFACIISPLLAGLLVLALPRVVPEVVSKNDGPIQISKNVDPPPSDESSVFEPDGALAGVPYRVRGDGTIEAIMQGARVKFRTLEHFRDAVMPTSGNLKG